MQCFTLIWYALPMIWVSLLTDNNITILIFQCADALGKCHEILCVRPKCTQKFITKGAIFLKGWGGEEETWL